MTKQLLIESCHLCPYSVSIFQDGTSFWVCKHNHYPYGRSNWTIINQINDDCPLDDVTSLGDLTPEDIQRINETARKIQNAKNVKDRRYG